MSNFVFSTFLFSGVGLKQSCAALSDLSFVLVKNGLNNFELGIIAKVLQKDDGV